MTGNGRVLTGSQYLRMLEEKKKKQELEALVKENRKKIREEKKKDKELLLKKKKEKKKAEQKKDELETEKEREKKSVTKAMPARQPAKRDCQPILASTSTLGICTTSSAQQGSTLGEDGICPFCFKPYTGQDWVECLCLENVF